MFRFNLLAGVAVFAGLLGACSVDTVDLADVKESVVHRQLKSTYDAETQILRIEAQGKVGGPSGTTIRYPDVSFVQVDGKPMKLCDGDASNRDCRGVDVEKSDKTSDGKEREPTNEDIARSIHHLLQNVGTSGTYYYYELKVKEPKASYTVTWKNTNGSEDRYVLPTAAKIRTSQGPMLAWVGKAPSLPSESIHVSLTFEDGNTVSSDFPAVPQQPGVPVELKKELENNPTLMARFSRQLSGTLPAELSGPPVAFTATYFDITQHVFPLVKPGDEPKRVTSQP